MSFDLFFAPGEPNLRGYRAARSPSSDQWRHEVLEALRAELPDTREEAPEILGSGFSACAYGGRRFSVSMGWRIAQYRDDIVSRILWAGCRTLRLGCFDPQSVGELRPPAHLPPIPEPAPADLVDSLVRRALNSELDADGIRILQEKIAELLREYPHELALRGAAERLERLVR